MKPRILVTSRLFDESFAALERECEVIRPDRAPFTPETAAPFLPHIDGLIPTQAFRVTREVIDRSPRLRIVANFGTGTDNIDVAYATERGVVVANTPDPVVEPTAELAYGLLLAAARGIVRLDRGVRDGSVRVSVMRNLGTTLRGKTLGIVGYGRIGQAVARYAHGSAMRILYFNRHPLTADRERAQGVCYAPLDRLLAEADFVTLHTPLTEQTRHLIGARELGLMKPTAFLINSSRGGVVDEGALKEALRAGRIAGAGLDVFETEPQIPEELRTLDNVILTPHAGTATTEARVEMGCRAADNILRFFRGEPGITRVN